MMKFILILFLLLGIAYPAAAQHQKCYDYQFIANYFFARRIITGEAVLRADGSTYTFGAFLKESEDHPDTTWNDPFVYQWKGNKIYTLENGVERLIYSDQAGDSVYSLFEYISPKPGFVAVRYEPDYRYRSRSCWYFENRKSEEKNTGESTTVVCIVDKDLKIPLYYEVRIYKFGELKVQLMYYSELNDTN